MTMTNAEPAIAADHTIEAKRHRRRTCTKAADLRGALKQLLEARAVAAENSEGASE